MRMCLMHPARCKLPLHPQLLDGRHRRPVAVDVQFKPAKAGGGVGGLDLGRLGGSGWNEDKTEQRA